MPSFGINQQKLFDLSIDRPAKFLIDFCSKLNIFNRKVRLEVRPLKTIMKVQQKMVRLAHHKVSAGTVHVVPLDLQKALIFDAKALAAWEDITPLARNEWICWVEFVKKPETRKDHARRVPEELKEGKRRPCCWIGCPHRVARG